jgi:hypothetical protein
MVGEKLQTKTQNHQDDCCEDDGRHGPKRGRIPETGRQFHEHDGDGHKAVDYPAT